LDPKLTSSDFWIKLVSKHLIYIKASLEELSQN